MPFKYRFNSILSASYHRRIKLNNISWIKFKNCSKNLDYIYKSITLRRWSIYWLEMSHLIRIKV